MPATLPPDPPHVEIVVTGRALPDPAAERAYSVETLNRKQLTSSPSHRLDELLGSVPGLQLFRRSSSTSAHPTSQGVTLRALGGNASSRALLVLDGVPQSDPFGGWVNWPAYDPAGLERVRVVRGGGSVPYGPGALAGVIEMESLARPGAEASIERGSRDSLDAHALLGGEIGASLLTVDAQAARSDGFIPLTQDSRGPIDQRSPFGEGSVRARFVAPVASDVELQASGLGFVDKRERGIPFTVNRTRGADASLRLVGSGRWQWSATGYGQWRNFTSSFASVDQDRTEASRVALQDSVPSTGFGGSVEFRPPVGSAIELRVGGDTRLTSGHSNELYLYVGGQPTKRRRAGGNSATEGAFAEASFADGPLVLSGGARLDHWSIDGGELVERGLAGGAITRSDLYPSRSGWSPTARAAAVLDAGGGLSFRSAAYFGWRMPTLNELFRPFRVGPDATAANPFLDPERLRGVEAGVRYRRGILDLSLTAFVNRLSHAIANVTLDRGPGIFPGVGFVAGSYSQRRNLDSIDVHGIEASAQAAKGAWHGRLGAAWSGARVRSSGAAAALDGLRPAQVPQVTLTGELGWQDRGREAAITVRHVGSQFEDDRNSLLLAPATTIGAFAAWPISDRIQLILRGENLLDERVIAGLDSDGSAERATPRTLWIGIRIGDIAALSR